MNWISDHLQLVLAIAGALAWWLNQRKQAETDEEPPPGRGDRTFDDPELAERTRRIRAEIQRKIEQWGRGYAAPEQPGRPDEPPEGLPPVLREVIVARAEPERPRGLTSLEMQRQAEILEQQAALAERLREAELMKVAAQKRLTYEAATADHAKEALTRARSTLLEDLRTPAALRRAFILREVLGPPVALRGK